MIVAPSELTWSETNLTVLQERLRDRSTLPYARTFFTTGVLVLSDLSGWGLAALLSVGFWGGLVRDLGAVSYLSLAPVALLFLAAYSLAGLYESGSLSPVAELRSCTIATSTGFAVLAGSTFLLRGAEAYSRAVFLIAWIVALISVPLFRAGVRKICCRWSWWGCPVVIFGVGEAALRVIQALRSQPELGLRPVAYLSPQECTNQPAPTPVTGGFDLAPAVAAAGVRHAILAAPELSRTEFLHVLAQCSQSFSHVIVLPDLLGFASLWVRATDLGGILGLAVRQQLLLTGPRLAKRCADILLTLAGGVLILPLVAVLALLVRVTSPGPVFYAQRRVGHDGQPFRAWKFRSMVNNADAVLQNYLQANPALRDEWLRDQKLRHDPRVTSIGRWMRRTSLDELPQLWNVLRGEMSLVGPRPIVSDEIARYGDAYALYRRVRPGITGLWQVSGRNNVTYGERVAFDAYYVRNWSVWLDLHLLARTVSVVLRGKGAY